MQNYNKTFGIIIVFVLLLLPLLYNPIKAEEKNTAPTGRTNSLCGGSWALAFAVTDNFSLEPFGGNMLSTKLHLSDKSAIRAGLGIEYLRKSRKPQGLDRSYEIAYGELNLNLVIQYIYYPISNKHIDFYIGVGPMVEVTGDFEERYGISDWDTKFNYGLQSNWGVEWFFSRNFSLFCEYGAVLIYAHDYVPIESDSVVYNQIGHYFGFRSTPVSMGLSVYF